MGAVQVALTLVVVQHPHESQPRTAISCLRWESVAYSTDGGQSCGYAGRTVTSTTSAPTAIAIITISNGSSDLGCFMLSTFRSAVEAPGCLARSVQAG